VNRNVLGAVLLTFLIATVVLIAGEHPRIVPLPTGKQLTLPVPGYLARTNSFPATIALSPDSRYAALLNMGYGTQDSGGRQSIAILDLTSNQLRDFPDARLGEDARQSYFIGMAFSSDGKHIYASMGSITDPTGDKAGDTGNGIAVYKFDSGQIVPERFIKIPLQKLAAGKEIAFELRKTPAGTAIPYPAGFAVLSGAQGDRLLVANNLSDNVVLLDATSGEILKSFDLSRSRYVPAAYPYTVIANKAGTKAWVSLWNESAVAQLDLETDKLARSIPLFKPRNSASPSSHPTAMLLNSKEDLLYVALSNADKVAAIDLTDPKRSILYEFSGPVDPVARTGEVAQALALSADGQRLYVSYGSLDEVAVFNVGSLGQSKQAEPFMGGFPTQWYPSALAIAGNDLLIAAAKGEGSGPNNGPNRIPSDRYHRPHPYIATLTAGSIARVSLADIDKNLAAYTRQVEEDNLLHSDPGHFTFAGGKNPIRHVIYILKENRTYDQILGDLPVGNGDPSLTMYGAGITPNEHKLALQFGVLDNFYDSGEVSGDGHLWSTAATTSDYNEKTWPIAYRGKERTYDFGGVVSEELPIEKGIPDIDDPGTGFLWDNLARSKLTYRVYGEFTGAVWCRDEKTGKPVQGTPSAFSTACPTAEIKPGEPLPSNIGGPRGSPWPWPVPLFKQVKPSKAALRDHYDPLFPDFNTDYPDQLRANEFLREFSEFVKARGTAKELPQFVLLYLPDDHTGGTRPGKPTPQASIADNDLALGRVVDAVSRSPYWDDTAIFVVEDDAQNGVDHVDAHRSIAFVISKYSPRAQADNLPSGPANKPFVDSHFYTTVGMIHTMEELLGLPPMNLFDAHAPLMAPLLSGPGMQPAYEADDRNLREGLIYTVNPPSATGARESSSLDFSAPDRADAEVLNAILWRNAKGDVPMPGVPHPRQRRAHD
jgi:DNA-binding beta-propeller fold protein YncE